MFCCLFYSSACLKYASMLLLENGKLIYLHNFLKEICMFGVYRTCLIQGIGSAFHCVVKIHLHSLFRITFQVFDMVFWFWKAPPQNVKNLIDKKVYDYLMQESLLIISVIVFLVCSRKLGGKRSVCFELYEQLMWSC